MKGFFPLCELATTSPFFKATDANLIEGNIFFVYSDPLHL